VGKRKSQAERTRRGRGLRVYEGWGFHRKKEGKWGEESAAIGKQRNERRDWQYLSNTYFFRFITPPFPP